jgi:outer membrane protein OmpA-like peptidoglycan-associated protein/tetratricopeptide (TPR) repeat protein
LVWQIKRSDMRLKYCILAIFFSMSSACLYAQSWKKLKSEANEYFQHEKYKEALKRYFDIQINRPQDMEVRLQMGICYYHTNNISNAKKYLAFVIDNDKNVADKAFYYLGKTYHADLQFKKAIHYYKSYLKRIKENDPLRASVKDMIRRCAFGMRIAYKEQTAIVENLSDKVNTSFDDFGPILSPNYEDKLYFSSARPGNLGGLRNEKGLKDDRYGNYRTDMYSTLVINGEWTATAPLSSLINSPMNDAVLGFNESGSVMFYFKGPTFFSGEILIDTFVGNDERSLFPSPFLSDMFPEKGDGTPHFFSDSTLIFASRRSGGYGGSDLYISQLKNGSWTKAQNLGPAINSEYDEITPFLAIDGRTLYFSSNNLKSIGGFDVFKAKFDDVTENWTTPQNLGLPINSAGDDTFFKLSIAGLKGFFSSTRKDGFGQRDLFVAYFKKSKKEQNIRSVPPLFVDVSAFKKTAALNSVVLETPNSGNNTVSILPPTVHYSEDEVVEYEFVPLYYGTDDRILTTANKKELNKVARLMTEFPQLKLILTSNSDGTVSPKFDLFFSAKRAEKVADYLLELGVKNSNIIIKGCGANYQIALNELESGPNPTGQRLNRRIDLIILNDAGLPVRINYNEPIVSKHMFNENGIYYQRSVKGLSYKIQIAAIKQMYKGDLMTAYLDPMVETTADSDKYKYTIGLFQTFYAAEQMRRELARQGVTDAFVVPYINGLRVDMDASKIYSAAYPDLKNFIEFVDRN